MFYREHALAYPKQQCTDLWQSGYHNLPQFFKMWWKTSSGRQEHHILESNIGLPYSEKGKRFNYLGLAGWDSTSKVLSLTRLSCLRVYCLSSSLLGCQPNKANESHPPGVSQVPAVTLLLIGIHGYHMEVKLGLWICATQ